MPKVIEDFIDGETFRGIKGLSLPEMNRFLYMIYSAGYAAGACAAGGEKLNATLESLAGKLKDIADAKNQ